MHPLAVLFGVAVGFSLGLTGGGGSIFAVPLLVYGLAVSPREAVGVSLGAVGATALVGAVARMRTREVELRTGLLFVAAGKLGAPVGILIGGYLPASILLGLFAGLMVVVAIRMWVGATRDPAAAGEVRALGRSSGDRFGPACRRDPTGRLRLSSRCAFVLSLAGVSTGILSGLFGVGGGFVVVPALVFFSGMDVRRAVATSLFVIALVSLSGLASFALLGESFNGALALVFAAGGVAGLLIGALVARALSGPALQKTFSVAIVLVAGFTVTKTIIE